MGDRKVVLLERHRASTRTGCAAVVLAWLEGRRNQRTPLTLDDVRYGIMELYSVPTIRGALNHLVDCGLIEMAVSTEDASRGGRRPRVITLRQRPERHAS